MQALQATGSCTRVHCGQGRSCLLDQNLSPHCVKCARKCPQSSLGGILEQKQSLQPLASRPVCGADGNTYKSACHLRLAACRAGRAIPVAYKGHCKQNADCTTIRCREGQTCLTEIKTNRPRCVTCMYRCPGAQRKHENSEKRQRFRGDDPGYPSVLCATNNMTYPSWCHIIKDACVTGFVLETKHAGPCNIHDTSIYDEENITSASYGVDLMDEVSKFSENLTRNN
ncbi:hypothetical protein G9C98_002772 [Cotesia typhae]|uniref:Kazal-like domain-containing protein n=1 Tax=Cotesia typhae TaxID=2053667 RepID=A0A8J5VD25_9HYME|nr:hypothetical protein G9C98_002772 [Cotesia typhae]